MDAHRSGARKSDAQDDAQKSDVQKRIDHSLKTIYDETLNEELPERFRELIAELRKQDSEK